MEKTPEFILGCIAGMVAATGAQTVGIILAKLTVWAERKWHRKEPRPKFPAEKPDE